MPFKSNQRAEGMEIDFCFNNVHNLEGLEIHVSNMIEDGDEWCQLLTKV